MVPPDAASIGVDLAVAARFEFARWFMEEDEPFGAPSLSP